MTETIHIKDGRRARSDVSRAKLLDAWLALEKRGDSLPTADQVCALANVSRPTLFRLTSMAALAVAGGERILAGLGITTLEGVDGYIGQTLTEMVDGDIHEVLYRGGSFERMAVSVRGRLRRLEVMRAVRETWAERSR